MSGLRAGWHNYVRTNINPKVFNTNTSNVDYNRIVREMNNKIKHPDISTHETFYHTLSQMARVDRDLVKSELKKHNIDSDRIFN